MWIDQRKVCKCVNGLCQIVSWQVPDVIIACEFLECSVHFTTREKSSGNEMEVRQLTSGARVQLAENWMLKIETKLCVHHQWREHVTNEWNWLGRTVSPVWASNWHLNASPWHRSLYSALSNCSTFLWPSEISQIWVTTYSSFLKRALEPSISE